MCSSDLFAAVDSARSKIGSPGAETYVKTIGGSVTNNRGPTNANNWNNYGGSVVSWHYHEPTGLVGGTNVSITQFTENSNNLTIWSKTPSGLGNYRMFLYYTTDGISWPEGAGGVGRGATKVAEMNWRYDQIGTDAGSWWSVANLSKPTNGTQFRYKIGVYQQGASSWFPNDQASVDYKKMMMSTFSITNFNPTNVQFHLHNDYNSLTTGLKDGFHVVRARAFLKRDGQAPLYQTFTQTFYYDSQTPQAALVYPGNNGDTVGGSSYEMVIRTDATVTEVWAHIDDSDSSNDDAVTLSPNGNGAGGDPFVDANGNGVCDAGETFTDLNGNGVYDVSSSIGAWVQVGEVTQNPAVENPLNRE